MTPTGIGRTLSDSEACRVVEQACRAPSIHNTQPWRFCFADGRFELWADMSRGLTISDPDGRELVMSCGAALFNLRLALRKFGFAASVLALPDPRQPRLLATIVTRESDPADERERRAYNAVTRRHTHRGGFDQRLLPPALAVHLRDAADAEGAVLRSVHEPGQRRRVLELARAADWTLVTNQRVREEIAGWTPERGSRRRDGVPVTAYPARPLVTADDIPGRDFDQGRGIGALEALSSLSGEIAVLATDGDLQSDWLTAGQALQHVLITAAEQWVFAALHSQVTEVPNLRAELRRELCMRSHPQMLLRFGYAADAPTTPRRPVSDVLDLT